MMHITSTMTYTMWCETNLKFLQLTEQLTMDCCIQYWLLRDHGWSVLTHRRYLFSYNSSYLQCISFITKWLHNKFHLHTHTHIYIYMRIIQHVSAISYIYLRGTLIYKYIWRWNLKFSTVHRKIHYKYTITTSVCGIECIYRLKLCRI